MRSPSINISNNVQEASSRFYLNDHDFCLAFRYVKGDFIYEMKYNYYAEQEVLFVLDFFESLICPKNFGPEDVDSGNFNVNLDYRKIYLNRLAYKAAERRMLPGSMVPTISDWMLDNVWEKIHKKSHCELNRIKCVDLDFRRFLDLADIFSPCYEPEFFRE